MASVKAAPNPDKFNLPNLGVPIFADAERDLPTVPGTSQDSWYVKGHFEAEGKQIGFVWHQQTTGLDPNARASFGEVILTEGTENVWIPRTIDEPVGGDFGASGEVLHVWSSYGALKGGRDKMELAVSHDRGAMDFVLTPKSEVLYNGATGYLALMTGSYEFAFPNVDVQGTVTIDGKVYDVPEGSTAWFDRQWTTTFAPDSLSQQSDNPLPAWLWIGTPINEAGTAAVSLWDNFANGTRRTFATILDEGGLQYNVEAEVEYGEIYTHQGTGSSYPRKVHVAVPDADLTLSFTAMVDEPVYDHGKGAINGSMSLSTMSGTYRGSPIDGHYILEMVGNLCG